MAETTYAEVRRICIYTVSDVTAFHILYNKLFIITNIFVYHCKSKQKELSKDMKKVVIIDTTAINVFVHQNYFQLFLNVNEID